MGDLAKKITSILALISVVFGGFFFLEARHAPISAFQELEQRVTLQELKRLLREAEEEMYHYKKLNRKYPEDADIAQKLQEAIERVNDLKERIKNREE